MESDEQLLERLAHARDQDPPAPSAAEWSAARDAFVTAQADRRAGRPVWRATAMVAVAASLVLALLVGFDDNRPAESVELARAKAGVVELQDAIEDRDAERASDAAQQLRRFLAALEVAERRQVSPQADVLLRRADQMAASTSTDVDIPPSAGPTAPRSDPATSPPNTPSTSISSTTTTPSTTTSSTTSSTSTSSTTSTSSSTTTSSTTTSTTTPSTTTTLVEDGGGG